MTRLIREFRLLPVVLLATVLLLGLKVLGIVLDGGYTLADLDFSSSPGESANDPATSQRPAVTRADALSPTPPRKSSWAQDMFNFPDVTGSVHNKPDEKPAEKTAEPKPGEKPAEGGAATRPVAPKAPPPDPDKGGTRVPLDANGVTSPAERAILERLGERRQELDARARELEIRENLLKSAEKRLDDRVNEIKGMESQAGSSAQKKDADEAARLKGLVTMYENMKAKDAAKIFDRLEMSVLIAVVAQINPRRMADIMAQMQPENAEHLTVELAGRGTNGAAPTPAPELPKIESRGPVPPPPK
jgi:flagellar motility protein MotE (MotC chaperone)